MMYKLSWQRRSMSGLFRLNQVSYLDLCSLCQFDMAEKILSLSHEYIHVVTTFRMHCRIAYVRGKSGKFENCSRSNFRKVREFCNFRLNFPLAMAFSGYFPEEKAEIFQNKAVILH